MLFARGIKNPRFLYNKDYYNTLGGVFPVLMNKGSINVGATLCGRPILSPSPIHPFVVGDAAHGVPRNKVEMIFIGGRHAGLSMYK
jgi:hypothetical protein